MKLLVVHQSFPGQYTHLARHLGRQPEHEVVFITQRRDGEMPGVRKMIYNPHRAPTEKLHHYIREFESSVINAQEVLRAARKLRRTGFVPDVMIGHNGWGEIWYLKEVYPDVPLVGYFEFFYRLHGGDADFDREVPVTPDTGPRLRTKNVGNLLGLEAADLGQCPTQWQKSRYPRRFHPMLNVIHEGIDSTVARPDPAARVRLAEAQVEVVAGDEVVTYVARNLEWTRGFHVFMRSLPKILAARPGARVLIAGGNGVSYGPKLPDGETARSRMLKELGDSLDLSRVHFLGSLAYHDFIKLLQVSRVHVYLTYPFVLSWSMLEAMSAGCLILGSRTPPVEEVIEHGGNGLLVDFFSPEEIAQRVCEALEHPQSFASLRQNARETILDRYDLNTVCLPAHLRLLNTLVPSPQRVSTRDRERAETGQNGRKELRNFRLLKSNLDLRAIREELSKSTLWVDMHSRPNRPKTQAHSQRIQMRAHVDREDQHFDDVEESLDCPGWQALETTRNFVLDFAAEAGGVIGRVRVSNLDPGKEIIPHIDNGAYYVHRDRYHLVINSVNGTQFTAGDETVTMHENELWWFDNKKMHSVKNLGDQSRTHLIFDLLRG